MVLALETQHGSLGVAIVHDEPLYASGVRLALRDGAATDVLVSVRCCAELEQALQDRPGLRIAIVALDPSLPEGYTAVERLRQKHGDLLFIAILRDVRPHAVRLALACGARAVLPTAVEGPELLRCVASVRTTGHYVNDLFREQHDHTGRLLPDPDAPPKSILAKFTPTELRLIRVTNEPGLPTFARAARKLKLTPSYVEDLRKSIYAKLGMRKGQRRPEYHRLCALWDLCNARVGASH